VLSYYLEHGASSTRTMQLLGWSLSTLTRLLGRKTSRVFLWQSYKTTSSWFSQ